MNVKIDKMEISIKLLGGDTVEETIKNLQFVINIVKATSFKEAEIYVTTTTPNGDQGFSDTHKDKEELLSVLSHIVTNAVAIKTLELVLHK